MATQFMACARYYTLFLFSLFWLPLRFQEPLGFARTLRKKKKISSPNGCWARSFVEINTISIGYTVVFSSEQDIFKLCFPDHIIRRNILK